MIDLHLPEQHFAIAGAGLLGSLLGWQLLLRGHRVTLFEKDPPHQQSSAAHTAAALISPLSEVVCSDKSIYDMGMRSLELWPQWLETLHVSALEPIQYSSSGSIVVAHPSDINELHQFRRELDFHLSNKHQARWLNRSDLRSMESSLAPQFEEALFLPDEAFLDNRALLRELRRQIVKLGGSFIQDKPLDFVPWAQVQGTSLAQFDGIFDCRGVGAQDVYVAPNAPLRGVRGEVLWIQTTEVTFHHPIRLMHPRYKLYIVPKPNNCFIVGATEIESMDLSPVSLQSTMELCSALYTLNPAFSEARITELDANVRPAFFDNMPRIEHRTLVNDKHEPQNIVHLNGLYRHGYLLGPCIINNLLNELSLGSKHDQSKHQQHTS